VCSGDVNLVSVRYYVHHSAILINNQFIAAHTHTSMRHEQRQNLNWFSVCCADGHSMRARSVGPSQIEEIEMRVRVGELIEMWCWQVQRH
jgi:hypothetical protein